MVCNMAASLYEPINVYKPVAPNIGIVDGPFEYLTVGGAKLPFPFTTRMTVVQLSNSELFLHSPIKFDMRLANEMLGLGAVRHLVSPNQFHYAHIGEGQRHFPMQFRGHRHACAKGPVPGMLMSTSRETSRPVHPKNGVEKSTKRFFPAAISRSSFSSTRLQRR